MLLGRVRMPHASSAIAASAFCGQKPMPISRYVAGPTGQRIEVAEHIADHRRELGKIPLVGEGERALDEPDRVTEVTARAMETAEGDECVRQAIRVVESLGKPRSVLGVDHRAGEFPSLESLHGHRPQRLHLHVPLGELQGIGREIAAAPRRELSMRAARWVVWPTAV